MAAAPGPPPRRAGACEGRVAREGRAEEVVRSRCGDSEEAARDSAAWARGPKRDVRFAKRASERASGKGGEGRREGAKEGKEE